MNVGNLKFELEIEILHFFGVFLCNKKLAAWTLLYRDGILAEVTVFKIRESRLMLEVYRLVLLESPIILIVLKNYQTRYLQAIKIQYTAKNGTITINDMIFSIGSQVSRQWRRRNNFQKGANYPKFQVRCIYIR